MATSGTVYSGYAMESRLYVKWTRTGTWNDSTCGSNLKWELYLDNHNWWYSNAIKCYPIYINGVSVYNGGTWSNKTSEGQILLASGTTTVPHNNDGTKTFEVKFSGWFYADDNVSGSQSFTLDTIPRASSFGTVSGVTMGSTMTININRNSSNFTHKLWYHFGTKTWQAIASGAGTSASFTIPLSLASEIPNDTYGSMTLILRTYNGSTQVGNDQTVAYRVHVPASVVPSVSTLSVSEATSGLATQFAAYVQYKSKLKVAVTAVGSYGSTIKSYSTKVGSTTYSGSSFTTGTMNSSGSISITTTVTDSRGRTASKTSSVSITQYYDPKATTLEAARCTSDGTLNNEGAYVKLTYKYDIASVGSKNSKSAKIQYLNGSTWTDLATYTAYTGNSSTVPSSKTFSVDSGWQFRLVVSDYFSTQYNYADISTGFTLMNFNADGTGVAFGKVSEISNTVEFGLEAIHYEQPIFKKGYKITGINTISSTSADTITNWIAQGNSVHYYNTTGLLNGQPNQWGILTNFTNHISDVHQMWYTQANGVLYHRGGNANGLSTSWKALLDSSNVGTYALPKSGGHLSGNVIFDSGYLYLDGVANSIANATTKIVWRDSSDTVKGLFVPGSTGAWFGVSTSDQSNMMGFDFANNTMRPTSSNTTALVGNASNPFSRAYLKGITLNGTDINSIFAKKSEFKITAIVSSGSSASSASWTSGAYDFFIGLFTVMSNTPKTVVTFPAGSYRLIANDETNYTDWTVTGTGITKTSGKGTTGSIYGLWGIKICRG